MRTTDITKIFAARRWDVIASSGEDIRAERYATDCFDDIKDEHKPACLLLMAARTKVLTLKEPEEEVEIRGVGSAVFFVDMPPVLTLCCD